jgi:hypothetical protein
MRILLLKIAAMLHTWAILIPQEKRQEFVMRLAKLKEIASRPARISGLI